MVEAYRGFVWITMHGVYEITIGDVHEGQVARAQIDPFFQFTNKWLTLADAR